MTAWNSDLCFAWKGKRRERGSTAVLLCVEGLGLLKAAALTGRQTVCFFRLVHANYRRRLLAPLVLAVTEKLLVVSV